MKKILMLAAALLSLAFASCNDNKASDFAIYGACRDIEVYADDTAVSDFGAFIAKHEWSVAVTEAEAMRVSNVDWMHLLVDGEEIYGGEEGTFYLSVTMDENYTGEDRAADITFYHKKGDRLFVVTVTQSATTASGVVPTHPTPPVDEPSEKNN